MTVSTSVSTNTYNGNGVTTVFPYTFGILADSEILVQFKETATGTITTKVLNTDYTVSGSGPSSSGGNITFSVAPASGFVVIFTRNSPFTQNIDYTEYDTFPAITHETGLDRGVILSQQLRDQIGLAIRMDPTYTGSTVISNYTANEAVFANNAGDGLEFRDILAMGNISIPVPQAQGGTGATSLEAGSVVIGTASRSLDDKLEEIISVLDYGADKTGVSDSTSAFNAAIAANTGKIIKVPAGNYLITTLSALTSGTSLVGESLTSTTLTFTTATGTKISITGARSRLENVTLSQNVTQTAGTYISSSGDNAVISQVRCLNYFTGITITGDRTVVARCQFSTNVSTATGISISGNPSQVSISDVHMEGSNAQTAGVLIGQSDSCNLRNVRVINHSTGFSIFPSTGTAQRVNLSDCIGVNNTNGNGLTLNSGNGTVDTVYVDRCTFSGNQSGIRLLRGANNLNNTLISNCTIVSNTNQGIEMATGVGSNLQISGCRIAANTNGILFTTGVSNLGITNCSITSNNNIGIVIIAGQTITLGSIIGNTVSGNTSNQFSNGGTLTSCMVHSNVGFTFQGSGLASQSDMETATSTNSLVAAGVQHFHPGHPKVIANFTSITTTAVLGGTWNVSSLTDNGTGDTTINFSVTMSSSNYAVVGTPRQTAGGVGLMLMQYNTTPLTATSARVIVLNLSTAVVDCIQSVAIFGDI